MRPLPLRAPRVVATRPRIILALTVGLLALAVVLGHAVGSARAATPVHAVATRTNPLAHFAWADRAQLVFVGRVRERLDAGRYTYVRVERDDRSLQWVVTLRAPRTVAPDARVRVVALGRARGFHSPRLARQFDDLLFGLVRPSA